MLDGSSSRRADLALFVLRGTLGLIFVLHGAQKLGLTDPARGWDLMQVSIRNFAAALAARGLEPALPLAWAVALAELLGGRFLALGLRDPRRRGGDRSDHGRRHPPGPPRRGVLFAGGRLRV